MNMNEMVLCADRATLQQLLVLQKDLMCRLSSAAVKDNQGHPSAANCDTDSQQRHICAEFVPRWSMFCSVDVASVFAQRNAMVTCEMKLF